MISNIDNEIIAQNCSDYTPNSISSYISFRARNCNECSNNIYGMCSRGKYENIKSSIKNN